jgi:hypothetical protein
MIVLFIMPLSLIAVTILPTLLSNTEIIAGGKEEKSHRQNPKIN